MAWQLRVYFDKVGPGAIPVATVDYPGDRPSDLDWTPPADPPWGKRGGHYQYMWYQNTLLEVPMLISRDRQFAEVVLQDMDTVIQNRNFRDPVDGEPGYGADPDTVMTQSIPAGAFIPDGTTITLEVIR